MLAGLLNTSLAGIALKAPEGPQWEFLILFLVVIVGPPLVQRARVPGIIGLLLGGFVIGPHGFGWIGSGNTTVPELGQLGLLYLMFVAGVELDLALLRVHRRAALTFSALTFIFPMAFGTILGFALGWSAPAAILLGSLIASYTLLLYPLARNAGLTSNPAVASVVGATVLTDTVALIILAVIAGTSTGGGSPAALAIQIAFGLVVLFAFAFLVLPRLALLAFRHLGSDRAVRYLIAVAAFLAAGTVADVVGIEPIVGAFFAGLAVNRLVPNEGRLMERIDFFGSAVFVPVFLVSVGLLLDPSVMVQGETLKIAGLLIVACLGGKYIAAWLARHLLGYTPAQGSVMFALSSPQAAATLAATTVGFNIGLFGVSVVNAALVLILVSIIVTTFVMERAKRGVPPSEDAPRVGERVLVALEDPAQAKGAFTVAARAARADGGVVRGLLASSIGDARRNQRRLHELETAAIASGIDTEPQLMVESSPADGIVNAAAAAEATLVLVGQHDDVAPSIFGTWTDAVAGAAPAAVVVLRGSPSRIAEVQLVSADASAPAGSNAALFAAELALRVGGPEVETREVDGRAWPGELGEGSLAILPVASLERFIEPLTPADGAALLLVLDPGVPIGDGRGARPPAVAKPGD